MSNISFRILIDGVDVSTRIVDDGWSITHTDLGSKRVSVKLYEKLYTMTDEVMIYYGDKLLFQGEIDKENLQPGMFTAYACDKLIILPNESAVNSAHREYANMDYTNILKDLLSYYFSGEFDVTNVATTGKTCGYIDLSNKDIFDCLRTLSKRAYMAAWLEPPNFLYWKPRDSVSTGFTVIYGRNISHINVTRDNFTKTKVIVNMKYGYITRGTGTRVVIVSDDTLEDENDAQYLGDSILAELQDIQIRGSIELSEIRTDLVPGQTCTLHAPEFGFDNETVRIKQVTITPYKTSLQVGLMTAMAEDRLVDFDERIRRMEARGAKWITACDTLAQAAIGCETSCEIECESACETPATCETGCMLPQECKTQCQTVLQLVCETEAQICGTEGTCQASCEAGHNCETLCQSQCQNACQTACQGSACETTCQSTCQTSCQGTCETNCQTGCETTCQTGCETSCQTFCQTTCQSACQLSCQTACKLGCMSGCETTCELYCEQQAMCCGTIGPD